MKNQETPVLVYRILFLALMVLCSYWIFFDIYRTGAFDVVPRDDYAPYLLQLVGEEGGRIPGSPFAYRLFSVVAAVPFYYILPVYKFTLLGDIDVSYLRALEALAMVSYLSILISSSVVFLIITKRFGSSPAAGLIGSLAMLLVMQFSGATGVDPTGIMLVCLLVYFSRSPVIFGIVVMLSAGFNEKVPLVLSMLTVSRYLFSRNRDAIPYAVLSVLAFAVYLSVRAYLAIPGNENQMDVSSFLSAALSNVVSIFTLKRIVLDILPVLTLGMLFVLGVKEYRTNVNQYDRYFSVVDISALVGLFIVCLGVNMKLNIGRVSIFCAPFYLPLAAVYIERVANRIGYGGERREQ